MNIKKRLETAMRKERGIRFTAAEVHGLAAYLNMSIEPKSKRRKRSPAKPRKRSASDPLKVHIRWMIRRDMDEVLEIERENNEESWSEKDYIRCLRQRNCIGMVAEFDDTVVGAMIYELHKKQIHVLRFNVALKHHGKTVGVQLVNKLKGKLSSERRQKIVAEVPESNLEGLQFAKSQGFTGKLIPDWFEGEDAIQVSYRYQETATV